MEIPYTVRPRPDTGLANPKLGIWLFIASEVMLFGGLFAGYIFMRLGAEPWMWPSGWLNVPVGTFNTFVLIASSVTIILSWEALKMKKYGAYKGWLLATWACGLLFLGVKLAYEWPEKFHHFGAYVQKDSLHKYETFLGNEDIVNEKGEVVKHGRISRNKPDRRFISGHLEDPKPREGEEKQNALFLAGIPYIPPARLDSMITNLWALQDKIPELEAAAQKPITATLTGEELKKAKSELASTKAQLEKSRNTLKSLMTLLGTKFGMTELDKKELLDKQKPADEQKQLRAAFLKKVNYIHVHEVDAVNATPYDTVHDHARFWPVKGVAVENLTLDKNDLISGHGAFLPRLNTYLACYFMITGLHGLHVLGGCIVFIYFWLNIKGGSKLYHTNHGQLCNRIEVAGLFWHLVDLVWIFVFPIFYLL